MFYEIKISLNITTNTAADHKYVCVCVCVTISRVLVPSSVRDTVGSLHLVGVEKHWGHLAGGGRLVFIHRRLSLETLGPFV